MTGVQTYVGSFTPRTTTGTQTVSGIGFAPVAIIFWANYSSNPTNAWAADFAVMRGTAAYDGTTYYNMASGCANPNGQTGDNGNLCASNIKCIYACSSAGSVIAAASVTAMDASNGGEFTLSWTTAYATARTVYYMAIGGDVTKASVVAWKASGVSTSTTVSQSKTGVGFKPSLVMHFAYEDTAATESGDNDPAGFMFGAMDANGNQFATEYANHSSVTTNASSQSTGDCIIFNSGNPTLTPNWYHASFTSMDTDGFTILWGKAAATPSLFYIYSLCLYNATAGEMYVGNFNKSIAVAPVTDTITTSLSGAVSGALFSTMSQVTQANSQQGGRQTFAGTNGTNSACIAIQDKYGASPVVSSTAQYTNETIIIANNDAKTNDAVALVTFNSNQLVVPWSTNNAVAVEIGYVVFGSASSDLVITGGAVISTEFGIVGGSLIIGVTIQGASISTESSVVGGSPTLAIILSGAVISTEYNAVGGSPVIGITIQGASIPTEYGITDGSLIKGIVVTGANVTAEFAVLGGSFVAVIPAATLSTEYGIIGGSLVIGITIQGAIITLECSVIGSIIENILINGAGVSTEYDIISGTSTFGIILIEGATVSTEYEIINGLVIKITTIIWGDKESTPVVGDKEPTLVMWGDKEPTLVMWGDKTQDELIGIKMEGE